MVAWLPRRPETGNLSAMPELPSGTITFLFSDMEGSTELLKQLGVSYEELLAEHHRILRNAFAAHGGTEVDTQGDAFFVAFRRAKDAVAAAVDAQRGLATHKWPEGVRVRVRVGLHTGEPSVGPERYVGLGVHKVARIASAGHGGQVLLSNTTRDLVEDELPPGVTIRDLGERRLKDLDRPERLAQLVIEGLPSDFGALNTVDVELRRKRRRMYAGSVLIGVAAAAVAIPVFALGQGSSGSESVAVAPNSVAVIDPASNRVVGSVQVGIRPAGVAVGAGATWVTNLDDRTLSRIDPVTRQVTRNIPLQATPTGLAVGAGYVWVANGLAGTVSRVDPSVNSVSPSIAVAPRGGAGSVAVGEGGVWAAFGDGTVARINAVTSRVVGKGVAGFGPSAVAAGANAVWVANTGDDTVSRMDPQTIGVVGTITAGSRPSALGIGAGSVWVANQRDGSVTEIDDASSSVTATVTVGAGPVGVALSPGAVWVANADSGTVSRIDTQTHDVVATVTIGNRPAAIAFGSGLVWVAVQAHL